MSLSMNNEDSKVMITEEMQKKIQAQKVISEQVKAAREACKPTTCIMCGKPLNGGICNSHSVPQMVLKTLTEKGMIYNKNRIADVNYFKGEVGLNQAGTFRIICRECDSNAFKEYEDPEKILQKPDTIMLAEIAIKDVILMLSTRDYEYEIYVKMLDEHKILNLPQLMKVNRLDYRDYYSDFYDFMTIATGVSNYGFNVLYWKVLQYVVPIAVQGMFTIYKDMYGEKINDPHDMDENKKVESVHLAIFPYDGKTAITLFSLKKDKSYRIIMHQMNSSSEEEKLRFINYLVFALADNYYMSKSISDEFLNNEYVIKLSREYLEHPNYGMPIIEKKDIKYFSKAPVSPQDLPVIFDEKYALT